jgi:hypothetical protein
VTPRELLRLVRERAWLLYISGGGDVPFETAQRQAAKEIVAEQKARPRPNTVTRHAATAADGITVKNARSVLLAQLRTLGERMRHPVTRPPAPATATLVAPPNVPPPVKITQQPEQSEPAPAPVAAGIFAGSSTTAELLPDDFPASASWADEPLRNWRKSIERNAAITKRDRWVG